MGATNTDEDAIRSSDNVALVHDELRSAILAGSIPAGKTSQVALARELGVGRTPLREALRMLQREGLVVSDQSRRVHIAGLSAPDAEELYVMRVALESVAVRITVPTLDSSGIAELEGLMAQMDHYIRNRDWIGNKGPHKAFHVRLIEGAGERTTTTIVQLFDHAERYRLAIGAKASPENLEERRAEHRAILDAAAAGDGAGASLRLMEHYARNAGSILNGLDPSYRPDRLRTVLEAMAPGAGSSLDAWTDPRPN